MNEISSELGMDGAEVRFFPPIFYVLTLGIGLVIHYWLWPIYLRFPDIDFVTGDTLRIITAAFIGLSGLGILLLTVAQFRRSGEDPMPKTPTANVFTTGTYQISRNPMYLGTLLIQAAIAVFIGSVWALVSVPIALILVQFLAIIPEEEYLERKFSDSYLEYKRSVRRWI